MNVRRMLVLVARGVRCGPGVRRRRATLDGAKIHSTSVGQGPKTIMLVHGWTCDESSWSEQVPALAKKYRVITMDLPGHGKSDAPKDGKFSMDVFARAVEAVRAEAKVDRDHPGRSQHGQPGGLPLRPALPEPHGGADPGGRPALQGIRRERLHRPDVAEGDGEGRAEGPRDDDPQHVLPGHDAGVAEPHPQDDAGGAGGHGAWGHELDGRSRGVEQPRAAGADAGDLRGDLRAGASWTRPSPICPTCSS